VNFDTPPTLILTGDGSHTLRHGPAAPTFHSLHGAVTESRHIYQRAGLEYALQGLRLNESLGGGGGVFRLLEIGLGTGLNAALVLESCREDSLGLTIEYTALEPFPVDPLVISQLNYASFLKAGAWDDWVQHYLPFYESIATMGTAEWSPYTSRGSCQFKVLTCPWPCVLNQRFDLIFWDAFGPGEAPHLWDGPAWAALDRVTDSGAIMVTFGASGALGRALQGRGWEVQRLAGPPGKREMIRAKKP